jgi:hypothetical protein
MQQRGHVVQWPCIGAQAASASPAAVPAARGVRLVAEFSLIVKIPYLGTVVKRWDTLILCGDLEKNSMHCASSVA